jgi:hypothetical protein
VVDAKHNIPIDCKVTNTNDTRAMSGMLRRAKTILGGKDFTALYDIGYHTGSEIKKALELNIEIMVAIPGVGVVAPDENYNFSHFKYDETNDTYTCPLHKVLTTNGNWYQKNKERYFYLAKHYKQLPFVKIYLYGGHNHIGPGELEMFYDQASVDSITSDINGNFSLKYSAKGKSDDYALGVPKSIYQTSNDENYLPDPYHTIYPFSHVYNLKDLQISARKLNYAKVSLQILSNPYDTLLFRIFDSPSGLEIARCQFFARKIDTILNIRYLPLSATVFEYSVRTLSLIDSSSGYFRITSDTLNLYNANTILVSNKFNSTYDVPLKTYR